MTTIAAHAAIICRGSVWRDLSRHQRRGLVEVDSLFSYLPFCSLCHYCFTLPAVTDVDKSQEAAAG